MNWTLRNNLQWNFNQYTKLFIRENAFENIVCKMATILSRRVDLTEGHTCLHDDMWSMWYMGATQSMLHCNWNYWSISLNEQQFRQINNWATTPGVEAIQPIFSIQLFSRFFIIVNTLFTYWISCSYLTAVTAAQLLWHPLNNWFKEHILKKILEGEIN